MCTPFPALLREGTKPPAPTGEVTPPSFRGRVTVTPVCPGMLSGSIPFNIFGAYAKELLHLVNVPFLLLHGPEQNIPMR